LTYIRNFDRINRPRIEASRNSFAAHVAVLRLSGARDIREFLASYKNSPG
jgi:hypothetical protein